MSNYIGKPGMLRKVNTATVEQRLYREGPLTKPELSQRTGLSLPTVSKLVDELEEGGRIQKAGLAAGKPGRKAMLYEANRDLGSFIALYYSRGQYFGRIANIIGETICEQTFPINVETAESALQTTTQAIDSLIECARTRVRCIGLGVPGVVLPNGSLMGIPKIEVWEGYPLQQQLEARYQADVCIANDVKLSAVGYYHAHVSDHFDNIVYVYIGNGLSSGIIINGRLYRGSCSFSGELGFMAPLYGDAPVEDFSRHGGFLETLLGRFSCGAPMFDARGITDPAERETLAVLLASIASNHVAMLNPDAIIFGGEVMSEALIPDIKRLMGFYTPPEVMPQILYDQSTTSGIEGLILTCRGEVTSHMQLIQNQGI
jgi:predicted NBD/HSP70 family sugar kinase